MTEIVDLHEDFLLQIFNYCDLSTLVHLSETCKLFKEIINGGKFAKIKRCVIRIHYESDKYLMCKILRYIGSYVNELDVEIWDDQSKTFLNSYFQLLGRHVGSNLRKLRLNNLFMKANSLKPLEPVLIGLTELEIKRSPGCSIDKFQTLCPRLEKLSIRAGDLPPSAWSTLKSVSLKYLKLKLTTFKDFVALNPQIVDLEVTVDDGDWLTVISKYLPNLETLAFYENSTYYVSRKDLLHLRELTKLRKLNLPSPSNDYGDPYFLNEFLLDLTKLTALREIKFNDNFNHFEDVDRKIFVKIALRLPFLEVFHFPLLNPEPRAVIEFLRSAKCLKEICIGLEHDDFDDTDDDEGWIHEMVDARKAHQAGGAPLKFLIKGQPEYALTVKEFVQRHDLGRYLCIEDSKRDI